MVLTRSTARAKGVEIPSLVYDDPPSPKPAKESVDRVVLFMYIFVRIPLLSVLIYAYPFSWPTWIYLLVMAVELYGMWYMTHAQRFNVPLQATERICLAYLLFVCVFVYVARQTSFNPAAAVILE